MIQFTNSCILSLMSETVAVDKDFGDSFRPRWF